MKSFVDPNFDVNTEQSIVSLVESVHFDKCYIVIEQESKNKKSNINLLSFDLGKIEIRLFTSEDLRKWLSDLGGASVSSSRCSAEKTRDLLSLPPSSKNHHPKKLVENCFKILGLECQWIVPPPLSLKLLCPKKVLLKTGVMVAALGAGLLLWRLCRFDSSSVEKVAQIITGNGSKVSAGKNS